MRRRRRRRRRSVPFRHIFPDEWKSARITPLYKKCGNRSDPSNYRPISIIPVVAKVFERIVYDQVYRYLTENKPWRHEKLSGIV